MIENPSIVVEPDLLKDEIIIRDIPTNEMSPQQLEQLQKQIEKMATKIRGQIG